ncbi:MAG: hypothetical protein OXI46_00025 [Gemmatimonadota bacterium]|nr:hypothetical protein [Gemmatimonadota bacterium]
MASTRKEIERDEAVREWSTTPSVNPRYKGATPAEVARALLKRQVCHTPEKGRDRPTAR